MRKKHIKIHVTKLSNLHFEAVKPRCRTYGCLTHFLLCFLCLFFFFLIYPKQLLELVVELTYFHLRSLIPCDSAVTIPILLFQQFHPWLVQESELILYSGLLKRWSGSEPSQLSGMAVYFWASQAFYHASHKNINNNNKSNKKISYIFSSLVALKHNLWHLLLTSFITEAIKNCCLPIFDHLLLLISHQV